MAVLNLERIQEQWAEHAPIDENDLVNQALAVPGLHQRWMTYHSTFKLMHSDATMNLNRVTKFKFEYYAGKAPASVYKEKPFDHKVLKGDLEKYVYADDEWCKAKQKIDYLETCLYYIEGVLRQISNRGYTIKNVIDLRKFEAGF